MILSAAARSPRSPRSSGRRPFQTLLFALVGFSLACNLPAYLPQDLVGFDGLLPLEEVDIASLEPLQVTSRAVYSGGYSALSNRIEFEPTGDNRVTAVEVYPSLPEETAGTMAVLYLEGETSPWTIELDSNALPLTVRTGAGDFFQVDFEGETARVSYLLADGEMGEEVVAIRPELLDALEGLQTGSAAGKGLAAAPDANRFTGRWALPRRDPRPLDEPPTIKVTSRITVDYEVWSRGPGGDENWSYQAQIRESCTGLPCPFGFVTGGLSSAAREIVIFEWIEPYPESASREILERTAACEGAGENQNRVFDAIGIALAIVGGVVKALELVANGLSFAVDSYSLGSSALDGAPCVEIVLAEEAIERLAGQEAYITLCARHPYLSFSPGDECHTLGPHRPFAAILHPGSVTSHDVTVFVGTCQPPPGATPEDARFRHCFESDTPVEISGDYVAEGRLDSLDGFGDMVQVNRVRLQFPSIGGEAQGDFATELSIDSSDEQDVCISYWEYSGNLVGMYDGETGRLSGTVENFQLQMDILQGCENTTFDTISPRLAWSGVFDIGSGQIAGEIFAIEEEGTTPLHFVATVIP